MASSAPHAWSVQQVSDWLTSSLELPATVATEFQANAIGGPGAPLRGCGEKEAGQGLHAARTAGPHCWNTAPQMHVSNEGPAAVPTLVLTIAAELVTLSDEDLTNELGLTSLQARGLALGKRAATPAMQLLRLEPAELCHQRCCSHRPACPCLVQSARLVRHHSTCAGAQGAARPCGAWRRSPRRSCRCHARRRTGHGSRGTAPGCRACRCSAAKAGRPLVCACRPGTVQQPEGADRVAAGSAGAPACLPACGGRRAAGTVLADTPG